MNNRIWLRPQCFIEDVAVVKIDNISYRRLGDVPSGNLVYLLTSGSPEIAIRVDHPRATTDKSSYPAAVVLRGAASGKTMPLLDTASGNRECIDLGIRP